ncbi:nucleolar protein 16 [Aspergillus luchuensis]|uniref:Nucleolar protein 16 n=1 Tax=Aspergillus kawachii TaxID=1069201 RepID=A0A146FYA6_ASPKA|nr:nucleolar protein 16 [Aspergillus luchuensis]BCS00528.1 nucleolar protein 16 [Aspergillus luchuensis]BCS12301.1 nucleolar protein 16 [Aspergillus luchuensis]GAA91240.1 60S ribosomal subunit biogenesis protein Nop16 [Aspergillus luchuensis IFO 4308]GAT29783.1 60S ribosomal subunit biogenesis protein Nop16 [Aspergillus luchuensis]
MVNIRQAKKKRSSLPKAKAKRAGLLKSGKKKINVLGNAIIAENWDRKQTLTQNYRRLGLVHRLNAPSGGSQKRATADGIQGEPEDSLYIKSSTEALAKQTATSEIKVERDPETGKILRVIRGAADEEVEIAGRKVKRNNPLNDPLNELSSNEIVTQPRQNASGNGIVEQLERQAAQEGVAVRAKKPRHQSTREQEWVTRLIEKHGDNYSAMARDRKLNPMQQTEGDLKRRIRKLQQSQS